MYSAPVNMEGLLLEKRQYRMQLDALQKKKKKGMVLQVRAFKNCNKWTPAILLKMKKFLF